MQPTPISTPRASHNFTLTDIHSQLSSFAYSTKFTHQYTASPLNQPLVLYRLQITAGLSQICHNLHSAVPALSHAPMQLSHIFIGNFSHKRFMSKFATNDQSRELFILYGVAHCVTAVQQMETYISEGGHYCEASCHRENPHQQLGAGIVYVSVILSKPANGDYSLNNTERPNNASLTGTDAMHLCLTAQFYSKLFSIHFYNDVC